jgi:hypothetical protein
MNILVKLLIALILGAVAAWVAGLILNHFWSVLIGIAVGVIFFFSWDTTTRI